MALYDPYDTGYTDYVTRMMRKRSIGFYNQTRSFGEPERLITPSMLLQQTYDRPSLVLPGLTVAKKESGSSGILMAVGAIVAIIFLFGKKKG